jgi:hypothetical protein
VYSFVRSPLPLSVYPLKPNYQKALLHGNIGLTYRFSKK